MENSKGAAAFFGFNYSLDAEPLENAEWYVSYKNRAEDIYEEDVLEGASVSNNYVSLGDQCTIDTGKITISDGTNYIGDDTSGIQIGDDLNLTTGGSSGYITTSPNIYTYPNTGTTLQWPQSGSTISISSGRERYSILELPREDECPVSVYVCGRMVTLGIIGTDVECAYIGDKLIFEPGVVHNISYEGRLTISVEYKDEIYHYNTGQNAMVSYKDNGPTLDATLVSTIQK